MRLLLPALACATAAVSGPAADQPATESGVFFREHFDDADFTKRGWYDGDPFVVTGAKPFAGRGCAEFAWKVKTETPAGSRGMRRLFEPSGTVYLSFRIRLSKDWAWSGRSYHPHLIQFLTTENGKFHGPAASHLTAYVEPVGGRLRLAAQDIQNRDRPHGLTQGPIKGGYNGKLFDSETELFADDAWHRVEAYFALNSIDRAAGKARADGVARGWFDGKLVIDRTDIVLRSPDFPDMKFNQLLLLPYFGRGLLPKAQSLWVDDLVVGPARPGRVE